MRKVIVSAVAAASALTAFKPVRGSSWESCLDLGRQHERQPMIKSAIAGLALSAVLASGAHAQFPGGPMDQFSATFRNQIDVYNKGMQDANAAAWAAYFEIRRRRALGLPVPNGPLLGYRPPLSCGPVYDPSFRRYNVLCR